MPSRDSLHMIPFPGGFVKHFFTNFAMIFCMLLSRTVVRSWRIFSPHAPPAFCLPPTKTEGQIGICRAEKDAVIANPNRSMSLRASAHTGQSPGFSGYYNRTTPAFFCVYGRTGPVLADRKIRGIATPACALVRNDMFYFSAINTNLSVRTDVCRASFRGLAGADGTEQNRNALAAGPARKQQFFISLDLSIKRNPPPLWNIISFTR